MNLDDAQKQQVKAWIDEGLTLSQIQSKLASELGKSMTYMEVRFLMDDLKLKPNDKQPPSSVAPTVQPGPAPSEPALGRGAKPTAETRKGPPLSEPAGTAAGGVSVTVDRVARPGALVSGRVTFSDGNSAEWYLDQLGRLGLAATQQGYRPSEEDVQSFQMQLQEELQKLGF